MSNKEDSQSDTQRLLERVRKTLPNVDVVEKRMFGGITLMLNGNMLCCASKNGLMVRVGKEAEPEALRLPHARPCDGAGHKMPGFIMIDHEGLRKDRDLATGVGMALRYVSTLPTKEQAVKVTTRRPKLVTHRP